MKHFTSFLDFAPQEINSLVTRAIAIKEGEKPKSIHGKVLGMLFFNPSLRTRVSFETAMVRNGGHAISLSGSSDVWAIEVIENAIMNGTKVEHIKDAARVLSRYCDALAIRSFAGLEDLNIDLKDEILLGFKKWSTVPVISMESAIEHPAQALADMQTIREKFGSVKKPKFTLTWAPHIKPLPLAVSHSALLAASYLGLDITIAHPKGFDLAPPFLEHARKIAQSANTTITITHDQNQACDGADIIYAKNWAPPALYHDKTAIKNRLDELSAWLVTEKKLLSAQCLMHCLPVRRNVEVSDDALDSSKCVIYDQAENRAWAQTAILESIFTP